MGVGNLKIDRSGRTLSSHIKGHYVATTRTRSEITERASAVFSSVPLRISCCNPPSSSTVGLTFKCNFNCTQIWTGFSGTNRKNILLFNVFIDRNHQDYIYLAFLDEKNNTRNTPIQKQLRGQRSLAPPVVQLTPFEPLFATSLVTLYLPTRFHPDLPLTCRAPSIVNAFRMRYLC